MPTLAEVRPHDLDQLETLSRAQEHSRIVLAVPTGWGDAWLQLTPDGDLLGMSVPGAPRPAGGDGFVPSHALMLAGRLADELDAYFHGEPASLLDAEIVEAVLDRNLLGPGHRRILRTLYDIPFGVTVSYGELAELAGMPGAARAAGTACARCPLPIVIPCHRVVRADGQIGNYATVGPDYKRRLLRLEGSRR